MIGKTLGLMRHATAESTQMGQRDIQRSLTAKGLKEAAYIAECLKKQSFMAEHFVISPAQRTRQTSQILAKHLEASAQLTIQEEAALYEGGLQAYFASIAGLTDEIQTAVLVGHNPDISALAENLLGIFIAMAPATFIRIQLPIKHWQEIENLSERITDYTVFSCESVYYDQSPSSRPHR